MNINKSLVNEICSIHEGLKSNLRGLELDSVGELDRKEMHRLLRNDVHIEILYEYLNPLIESQKQKDLNLFLNKSQKSNDSNLLFEPSEDYKKEYHIFQKQFKIDFETDVEGTLYCPPILYPFAWFCVYIQVKKERLAAKKKQSNGVYNNPIYIKSIIRGDYIRLSSPSDDTIDEINDLINFIYYLEEVKDNIKNVSINLYFLNHYFSICSILQHSLISKCQVTISCNDFPKFNEVHKDISNRCKKLIEGGDSKKRNEKIMKAMEREFFVLSTGIDDAEHILELTQFKQLLFQNYILRNWIDLNISLFIEYGNSDCINDFTDTLSICRRKHTRIINYKTKKIVARIKKSKLMLSMLLNYMNEQDPYIDLLSQYVKCLKSMDMNIRRLHSFSEYHYVKRSTSLNEDDFEDLLFAGFNDLFMSIDREKFSKSIKKIKDDDSTSS